MAAANIADPAALGYFIASTSRLKPEETQGEMGKGPMLCTLDARMIPNRPLRDFVARAAEKAKIPYQYTSLVRGGTDGGRRRHCDRGARHVRLCRVRRFTASPEHISAIPRRHGIARLPSCSHARRAAGHGIRSALLN